MVNMSDFKYYSDSDLIRDIKSIFMEKKYKEFFATSWAIDNKISVYVLVFIISVFGIINYYTIPKEQIPEIVIPMMIVNTIYPGTSPSDMENLVTRPLGKES